jgi:type II secretory pathway component GspD/PulD (secretin)
MSTRKLAGLILVAVLLSACTAGRAFRHGQEAVRNADWDAAVTYFTKAVQANPDNAEYKINLQRAQEEAARVHIEKGRELEKRDQLDGALAEYRRALELDAKNRLVATRVAELEKTIREKVEASRPVPRIEQLRQQARTLQGPPLLNPASRDPLRINFNNASLRDILNFIGTSAGINVTYDQQFVDKPFTVNLEGVTLEEALQQILTANQYYYKVLNPRTIIVIPDQPAKHAQYDELVVRVFYISHADATELAQLVNSIMRIPQMTIQPMVMPNKTANTITVRATGPVVDVIERVIRANDKPRAEVILDVEILEVSRARVKQYGINLSSYTLNVLFSPELAPPNTSGGGVGAPPPFNLNTISQGVSTADFYLAVPTAVVNFLESDNRTKTLAKPQLRGQEGQKLTLNLGQDIPVVSTVFGAAAAGGFATIPQSSYSYRTVGVNMELTPRVTYEGEVVITLALDNSALGNPVDVAGQSIPSFTTRKVSTTLRLREGESNLLAGLISQDTIRNIRGPIGLIHVPVIKELFANNDNQDTDRDIVMLITPHIVRTQELTAQDLGSIYIGTQSNVGLSGPPPLIAPQPEAPPSGGEAAPGPGGVPPPATAYPGTTPTQPPLGVPRTPAQGQFGVPTTAPPLPPGTSPVPTTVAPTPPTAGAPTTAPGVTTPPATPPAPPTAEAPPTTTPPAPATPTGEGPATGRGAAPPSTPAQIIVTPAGTTFQVAGGPYTTPISINNATRISVITLTVNYNPAVLRVRTVQDGTFMRQGGVTATFTPRIDAAAGRVDIAISRTGDQTGASGSGLLAALLFDAVAPGSSQIAVTSVANTPDGAPVPVTSAPVTVTVR